MSLELAEKIENAFANNVYPGDDNIGDTILEDFVGQSDWKQVPLKTLLSNHTEIPLFTAQAYYFYLPAFLCALLREPEAEYIVESVIDGLRPSSKPDRKSNAELAIHFFSDLQKGLISEFLQMHKELFPHSNFNILEDRKAQLQQAIQFWKSA